MYARRIYGCIRNGKIQKQLDAKHQLTQHHTKAFRKAKDHILNTIYNIQNTKKSFIVINEAFTCKNCGNEVETLKGSCRNHCPKCLFSLHVDENTPGDRESECHGPMEPIGLEYKGKKGYQLIHKCLKCGGKQLNIVADDDDQSEIQKINLKQ